MIIPLFVSDPPLILLLMMSHVTPYNLLLMMLNMILVMIYDLTCGILFQFEQQYQSYHVVSQYLHIAYVEVFSQSLSRCNSC